MLKYIISLLLIIFVLPLSVHARPAGDSILISEIEYDPAGSEPGSEWFELYNPTENSIDISGWELTDGEGTFVFPPSTIIPSGGYFIAVHTITTFNITYPGITPDLEYSTIDVGNVSLANGGDELTLSDSGTIIDFVSWEGHTPTWDSIAGNSESIARSSSTDTDTSSDWLDNQTPSPQAGTYSIITSTVPPASSATSSRKGGSIRYVCKNPEALNYTETRFGRHRESRCRYDTLIKKPTSDRENLCKKFLDIIKIPTQVESVRLAQTCLHILGYDSGMVDGIYGPQTSFALMKYKNKK